MKLRVLPSAIGDLSAGRSFYSEHGKEVGDYFLDYLFADIDSLAELLRQDLKAALKVLGQDEGEALFIQMTLGDDRAIESTYVAGTLAHTRTR